MHHLYLYPPVSSLFPTFVAGHLMSFLFIWVQDTVCPSGCSFSTIYAAVNAAQDGDIIDLTAPTYDIVGMSIQRSFTMRCANQSLSNGPQFLSLIELLSHIELALQVSCSREDPLAGQFGTAHSR